MLKTRELIDRLNAGDLDEKLRYMYAADDAAPYAERFMRVIEGYKKTFGDAAEQALFSAPGRTEIGGNHTDHQHGCVLAGSVNLDVVAAV